MQGGINKFCPASFNENNMGQKLRVYDNKTKAVFYDVTSDDKSLHKQKKAVSILKFITTADIPIKELQMSKASFDKCVKSKQIIILNK